MFSPREQKVQSNKPIFASRCVRARLPAFVRRGTAACLAAVALLLAGAAEVRGLDEEPEAKEEAPIVITATRIAQPKATVSSKVTVITKQEIEQSGARTVGELLSRRSEVDVRSYGPLGAVNVPSLRGSATEQVLVLVDGVPVNPPQGGGVDLTDYTTDGIERIEVLHGAASAHYGSSAVGGVINIITADPTPQRTARLQQQVGSFGSRVLTASLSDTAPQLGYALSLGHTCSDGDFPYLHPSGQTKRRTNADYEQFGLRARILPRITSEARVSAELDWSTSNKGVPGLVYSPSPRARQEDDRTLLAVAFDPPASSPGGLSARLYFLRQRRRFDNPDAFPAPQHSLQRTHTFGLTLSGRLRHDSGSFTYGLDARWDRLASSTVGSRPYDVVGIFAQEQLRTGRTTIIPALRWDSTRRIGSQLSPHIGLLHRLADGVFLRANLGRSFRTPSLNDLYWPEDPYALGNPSLKSERGTNVDLGIGVEGHGPLTGSVTLFRNAVSNLILWQPGVLRPGKWSPTNVGRAVTTGVELDAKYVLRAWSFAWSASLVNARDRTSGSSAYGKRLIGRPTVLTTLRIGYSTPPWMAELALRRTGRRYESPDNSVSLPPFTTADLRLSYSLGRSEVALHIPNLTDRRYETVPGYPVPGRSVYLTLTESM